MNYSKEVVHFVRLLNALHSSSPSRNPLDLIELIQRSPVSPSAPGTPNKAGNIMGSDSLYGHHLEPTTLHGVHLLTPADFNGSSISNSLGTHHHHHFHNGPQLYAFQSFHDANFLDRHVLHHVIPRLSWKYTRHLDRPW